MEWILDRLPVLVFVIVAIVQVARVVMKSRDAQAERREGFAETEEQQRVRQIQERFRRIATERGQGGGAPAPVAEEEELLFPPILQWDEAQPEPVTLAPRMSQQVLAEERGVELERQRKLAGKLRLLEEARELDQRRADRVAVTAGVAARSEAVMLRTLRARLDADLRDAESLRRAFVLREVLGPPVGLR